MSYPEPTQDQVTFFKEHGWLVVEDAIDLDHITELGRRCDELIERRHELAFDWAWDESESKDDRSFRIVQSTPAFVWPEITETRWRSWAVEFASALMGEEVEFWYDQFLGKPPDRSVPTYWHQDEGYWGRNLDDRGLTCWTPLHDVDEENGCMFFIDRGHQDGVLEHRRPPGIKSDLLSCGHAVDEARAVPCPIKAGSVTFHHSKTPHMTTANQSSTWRKAVTQHLRAVGAEGEGDHYPWKVYVDQRNDKLIIPERR